MREFMKMIILVVAALIASGCAIGGLPGETTQKVSEFDNAKEIHMQPAWVADRINLGFYRTSKMEPDKAVMIVEVASYGNVVTPVFAAGKSLHFKIDGNIYSFESDGSSYKKEQRFSEFTKSYYTLDTQEYATKRDFLKALMMGKRVVIKVDLVGNKYEEGVFPDGGGYGGQYTVRPNLANFYKQAFGN